MVQERNIEALDEIVSENIDKESVSGTHGTGLSTILNWISRAISWLVSKSTAICLKEKKKKILTKRSTQDRL